MKAWFFDLQMRERWLVAIGAAAAVVIVVWGFVLLPLNDEVERLRASVDTKQRLLIDVARIEGESPASVATNRQGNNQTLMVIVGNTAGSHGINPSRTTANGPSGVNVSIQNASFDALAAWLVTLHESYGIDVESASFSNAREPGLVNGQLSLRRL
jgi:type II secretory pathway component PulM